MAQPAGCWGFVVLAGAVLTAVVPFVARPFLNVTINGIDSVSTGAVLGSFFACVILFVPSVLLLGMVTPFAIRIGINDMDKAGSTAGRIFALSTAGSLLGTFLPRPGDHPADRHPADAARRGGAHRRRGVLCSWAGGGWSSPVVLAGLIAIPPGSGQGDSRPHLREGVPLPVRPGGGAERQARLLYLNEGFAVHSIWRPDTVLTGGEWDMFLTVPPLLERPVKRIAILGNAGGTTARAFGVYYPDIAIDGVEIDPEVNAVAKKYFGVEDNPRLNVVTADARPFLQAAKEKYDLIFIDAYRQPYVPFYLATADFFKLCRDHLTPDGIVALNVSTVPGDDRLSRSISGTLATQFPLVMKWPALRFNQLVLGLRPGHRPRHCWPQRGATGARATSCRSPSLLTKEWTQVAADGATTGPTTAARWSGSPTA